MSAAAPTLPVFQEGQILAASSLTAMIDYARGQLARHERYLHDWGIATGLALTESPNRDSSGNNFADITLSPGVAIDGYGAEIIVPSPYPLDYNDFQNQKIAASNADPNTWYPVFLQGQQQTTASSASTSGMCGPSQSAQTTLGYQVSFGRPGSETDVFAQVAPSDVTTGAGPAVSNWKILIGFVQWSGAALRFSHANNTNGTTSVKYAGVLADTVRARGTTLTLATVAPAAMVVVDSVAGLQFGLQDPASGKVNPVFSVSPQGDVKANGAITGTVPPTAQFCSGTVSDGMLLPLPAGITEAQVTSAAVTLTTHLTPRYQGSRPAGFPVGDWTMLPLECRVDGRYVRCRVRWSTSGSYPSNDPVHVIDLAGVCDYLVIATPASKATS